MTTIVGTLPTTIKNGDLEDATVLMSLFTFIQAQINANGAANGANADITSMTACTAISPLASINGGPISGLRNRLHNGNFQINQRAVSGTVTLAAGAYGHDRWKAGAGGCTYTFATTGIDTVITITAGSLMQVVEDKNVEGGVFTLSNKGTAQARIAINGASTSGSYAACPLTSASATGGQTMSVEFTTGTLDRAQLEPGSVASTFERRTVGVELFLCQRFYETQRVHILGSAYTAGAYVGGRVTYKVPKRAAASVGTATNVASTNFTGPSTNNVTADGFTIFGNGTAAGTLVEYVADIPVSADL